MVRLLSTKETILQKIEVKENPKIVFSDLDGTLFSPNINLLNAAFTNRQTSAYLKEHSIPFVIVTGRSDWKNLDQTQIRLLGFLQPDTVITANGSVIYHLLTNKLYSRDMEWEALMHYSKVKLADGKVTSWNKLEITNALKAYFLTQNHKATFGTGNTFMIRVRILDIPYSQLEQIRKDILRIFPSGVRITYTEKLLRKNTLEIFSGELLITPKYAGKDNAVTYVLDKYAKQTGKILKAYIFGDATVDVPMLTMKDNPKYYSLSQYLVHPVPMAKKVVEYAQKNNINIHILLGDGPKEIMRVVTQQPLTDKREALSLEKITPTFPTSPTTQQSSFSPAQNNPIRQLVKKFEPLLNNIVDKNLSPNEVSFLGLTKLQEGLNQLYSEKNSALQKIHGLYNYGFGNLTDVLDGIRARQLVTHNSKLIIPSDTPGQLVDGFADRAKEFMQLFMRGKNRQKVETFLTALSCALPSIARAQVEITGKTVKERDEKGGSMIDRTKKLSFSIIMDTIGARQKSEAIDQEIYSTNIATFKNRLNAIPTEAEKSLPRHPEIVLGSLSEFQRKALERWLLYIDVLQQEDTIIKKYLSKFPTLLKEYEKESQKLAKDYLALKVNVLRKKWNIEDYKLQIKNFLI